MTSESFEPVTAPSRRTALAAVGAAGLAVALTACSSDGDSSSGSSSSKGTSGSTGTAGSSTAQG